MLVVITKSFATRSDRLILVESPLKFLIILIILFGKAAFFDATKIIAVVTTLLNTSFPKSAISLTVKLFRKNFLDS